MSKELDAELEKPETWDFVHPQVRKPVKASRVVVSVAFHGDDFDRVSVYAESVGKKTSEFIRDAAIEKASGRESGMLLYGSGGTGTLWWTEKLLPITRVSGSPVEHAEPVAATTHG